MNLSAKTVRTTNIHLNSEEFHEAIRQYLKSKDVSDFDQHLVLKPIETRDERGIELEVTIKNYNKDNNIYK